MTTPARIVAVTGASGYIGSFVCAELLERGYQVHVPVRGDANKKLGHLMALPGASERLKVFEGCDLSVKGSFDAAFAECEGVVHTAAKVELSQDPEVIRASVEGVENVLASLPSVDETKFVHTSSIAAIQTYDKPETYVFSEDDWNDWSRAETDAYGYAKTKAERAVADFGLKSYVALNPSIVIGPVMTKQHTKASAIFLRNIIYGNKVLNVPSNFVDVRDVAAAHVRALERIDQIEGPKRFVLTCDAPCANSTELATRAARVLPEYRFSAPPMYDPARMKYLYMPLSRLPLVGSKIMSDFDRLAFTTPIHFSNSRAKSQLGLEFRDLDATVRDGVLSVSQYAKLKKK